MALGGAPGHQPKNGARGWQLPQGRGVTEDNRQQLGEQIALCAMTTTIMVETVETVLDMCHAAICVENVYR